jgi:hypothetical protein
MCCLGFYARKCGLSKTSIIDVATPHNVSSNTDFGSKVWKKTKKGGAWLFDDDQVSISEDCLQLIRINDSGMSYAMLTREAKIIEIFAKHGVEAEFVG